MVLTSFEQSRIWQASILLASDIYILVKKLPDDEKFALSSQIRRAVVSISTNIAEGFGRTGIKEKVNFYNIAYGSLLETKSLLLLSVKIGYMTDNDIAKQLDNITSLQKQINATKTAVKAKIT